jgi:hypothetical protein
MGTNNKMKKNNIIEFPMNDKMKHRSSANIALLSPRTHAQQPYSERTVIFTDNDAYIKVKKKEGWEAMLRSHYIERTRFDEGPPRVDYSWVRKIVEPIYAKIRRSRKKY